MLDELGIAVPTTWDELVAAMQKVKDSGKVAVAHGGQPWQDATIFDAVAMSTGGPEFYKKAFIDLDPETLGSDTMKEVFDRMTVIRGFVDDNFSGREWNLASAMVINGDAAFQFMGDWAKGEFLNAGKVPDQDFLCFRFPGTQDQVTFNSDVFVDVQPGRRSLAGAGGAGQGDHVAGVPDRLQQGEGLGAGAHRRSGRRASTPAARRPMTELKAASASGNLFGSMAHGHANPASVKNAMYDVITAHFNGEYDSETAVEEMVSAVELSQ